jgi:predicted ATP-binding protein involved in virulence
MSDSFDTHIDRLSLENFRLFKSMVIDFHPRLTVLTAPNGGGKTAVLDAVAGMLKPYLDGLLRAKYGPNFTATDIRRDGAVPATHAALTASGFLEGDVPGDPDNPVYADHWRIGLSSRPGGKFSQQSLSDLLAFASGRALLRRLTAWHGGSAEERPTLPALAYYRTSRRIATTGPDKPSRKTKAVTNALEGYVDWDNSLRRYGLFEDWFWRQDLTPAVDDVTQGRGGLKAADATAAVNGALQSLRPHANFKRLLWDRRAWEMSAEQDDGVVLPVRVLSDGFSTMVAMVGDLAHRCIRLNPHLGLAAPQLTSGIVLIDEVDMHLHPAWQQTVIASLLAAFPKIQFIVTTHSPQVLSTVDNLSIRVVHPDGQVTTPAEQTKGVESPDILARVMGVNPVPHVAEAQWLRDYHALIENGEGQGQAATELRTMIVDHFGERHHVVLDCDRMMRWQQFKQRRSAGQTEG